MERMWVLRFSEVFLVMDQITLIDRSSVLSFSIGEAMLALYRLYRPVKSCLLPTAPSAVIVDVLYPLDE
jgi:hypothetical protein